jgi:tRNA pseudouridine32 synthase/23S rRNA pseudouridine746 synthase/23S rRNA pseudouridine1911/1915/1917 synthase
VSVATPCTPPARKFQPKGLTILHEDRDIIVIDKPAGLLTIGSEHNKTATAHYILNDYVRKGDPKSRNRVFVVHRLDQATSGLLIFAKSTPAKLFLQQNWSQTNKHYLAIVHGHLTPKDGTFTSYLNENSAHNVYPTSANQGKLAKTAYRVIKESTTLSLIDIQLLTGRKHQIRVHFAENGHPLVGKGVEKYHNGTNLK